MAARDTKRLTKKLTPAARAAKTKRIAPAPTPPPEPEPVPLPEPAPAIEEPIVEAPTPPRLVGDWIPVIYRGDGVFADPEAGVFAHGTRTRLARPVAERLLRHEGFRLAA